jgi:hypothetical protein
LKFFPVKIMIICLIMPPLLYTGTLYLLQAYLEPVYQKKIEKVYLGDTSILFEGTKKINEAVVENISQFYRKDFLVRKLGLNVEVIITTNNGQIIFPAYYTLFDKNLENELSDTLVTIARENWKIINNGFNINVSIEIGHGTKIAFLISVFYITIFLIIFMFFYKKGLNLSKEVEKKQGKEIDELIDEKQHLFDDIKSLNEKYQSNKRKAKINEDEMFLEIVNLEEKLNSFIKLKKENESLKLEKRKSGANKRKTYDFMVKRFSVLYTNISINRKAMTGFNELSQEMQIKAEEIIHQLNNNSENVIIKRKVFLGKRKKSSFFEVIFGYTGRLYFKRTQENLIEIIVIGTKTTQHKDMEFLNNL